MIPEMELDLLVNTAVHAVDLANLRLFSDGHGEPVNGLRRVEAIQRDAAEASEHEEWMTELVIRWQFAVDEYGQTFGVRMGVSE